MGPYGRLRGMELAVFWEGETLYLERRFDPEVLASRLPK
jgi:hypothetical protein